MEEVLYRWLHISDLHVFDSSEKALIQREFSTLAEHFHPHFLVVTGDFRHKAHAESDFSKALDYLNAIVKAFQLKKKDVYLVPGNHDVNNYDFREECISKIREGLKGDSDSYTKYNHGEIGDLYQGFSEYIEFVHSFYGDELDADDPRLRSPADVIHCIWENKVNLVLLNTALISTRESSLAQICDIHSFCNLEIENSLPTLVLGHHGLHRMHDSHKGKMEQKLNYLKACVYLCGDSHKLDKQKIQSVDPATFIPQYTCGKSAPETGDAYSDLCSIGYTCKTDGKAYVQVYKYEKNTTGNGAMAFHDTPDFKKGLLQDCFKMQNPVLSSPCTKTEEKREQKATTISHDPYKSDWPTIGREDQIKEITDMLSLREAKMLWVSGVAGIGKTDLCKAVGRAMIRAYPGWDMPYIHTRDIGGYFPFIHVLAQSLRISLPNQQDLWIDCILEELDRRTKEWCLAPLPALYFDNFEDVQKDCSQNDLNEIYELLFLLRYHGYHLMFSSQTDPDRPEIHKFPLHPLTYEGKDLSKEDFLKLESAQLFCQIWGRTPREGEWAHFRKLIHELNGHPLAIVLTANMARKPIWGLARVAKNWPSASQQAKGSRDRHSSLDKALILAWNTLKDKFPAVLYWTLQYHSVLPIPNALLSYFATELPEADLEKGIDALAEYNLIYGDETSLTMLRPIQQQLPRLLDKTASLEYGLQLWAKALLTLLEDVESKNPEYHYEALELFLPLMPQLLHILEQLADRGITESDLLIELTVAAMNYYQYYLDSVHTLAHLSKLTFVEKFPVYRAFLLEHTGFLQSRLGMVDEALKLYDQAEKLCRNEKANLELANTLRSKGELQLRLGNLDDASEFYDEAEKLYRNMQEKLGIANTLLSKGFLQFRLGKIDDTIKLYDEAEKLYQEEQDNLGLANTLLYKGELQLRLGKIHDAMDLYDEAEMWYWEEKDNLGIANTLLSKGELQFRLGNLDDALSHYNDAEKLCQEERDILSIAHTLLRKGEIQFRLGKLNDAMIFYVDAESLFRRTKSDLGLANIFQLKGDLSVRQGQIPKALELLDEADTLYRKVQDMEGLADLSLSYSRAYLRKGNRELALEKALEALRRSKEIRYAYGTEKAEKLLTEMEYPLPV